MKKVLILSATLSIIASVAVSIILSNLNSETKNIGATPVLTIKQGGTGTSTTPGAGKFLLGNGTKYDLVATSTLNIPTTASTSNWQTAYSWGNHSGLYPTYSYASSTYAKQASTTNWDTAYSWGDHAGLYPTYAYASSTYALNSATTTWNTAYTDRLKWDGGATDLVAATGRTSLGLGTMSLLANTGSSTITTLGTIDSLNATDLTVQGTTTIHGLVYDGFHSKGLSGQFLKNTGTSTQWVYATSTGLLISGGTLTNAYHCRYDGVGLDCDRVEDASGDCAANAVCMGGHTHSTDAPLINPNFTQRVGIGTSTHYPSSILTISSTSPSYLQTVMVNLSQTASSSVDYVANNASSTDTTWYTAMGQNGSGWNATNWTINGKNDGYLYTNGGNLAVGTASSSYMNFFTGGTLLANERMRITAAGNVGIGTSAPVYALDVVGFIRSTLGLILNAVASLVTSVTGQIGIDTTSGQLRYNDGVATRTLTYLITPTVTIASTSIMSASATTTIPIGFATMQETWNSTTCGTDSGTSTIRFSDGTSYTNVITVDSTPRTTILTTLNTFHLLDKRQILILTTTGSPNYVSCTVSKTTDSD